MLGSDLADLVTQSGFEVIEFLPAPEGISFVVRNEATKTSFLRLYDSLRERGYLPLLRMIDGKVRLSIIPGGFPSQTSNDLPWILGSLILTSITVGADFLLRYPILRTLELAGGAEGSLVTDLVIYVFAFLVLFGLHELGHRIASMKLGIPTRGPYFIPGIPGMIPTFGAVILQNAIPRNRDELVDIGFSGPFYGFIGTMIVTYFAVRSALMIPLEAIPGLEAQIGGQFVEVQPFVQIVSTLLLPRMEGFAPVLGVLGLPMWLGFLVTFINLFPGGQLDGGHIARAVLGGKLHMIFTAISAAVLFFFGFWLMALLVLITWEFREHPGSLDDVSGLSINSKLKVIGALAILLVSFTRI